MIKTIRLKFGSAPGMEHTFFDCTPMTVFVGPNNSGKSKVLSEIQRYCTHGTKVTNDVILDELTFNEYSAQTAEETIKHVTLAPNRGESLHVDHIIVGKRGTRHQVPKQGILKCLQNSNEEAQRFCQWYLAYNTIILNGQNRINLIQEQDAGDLQQPAHSSFQVLFRDDDKRSEVRRIVHEAFGSHFVIDPTKLGKLRIKLAKRAPLAMIEERGIHEEAVRYHADALPIEQTSDGVKAFTGMITEIIAGDPKILLIDEPEAFLHPSLSYSLGKEIAQATVGSDKRIFVSTHSPNFVMGCIQSGTKVNIVRLTYHNELATARVLPNDEILRLMRNPLLRSTGVLEGLFYEYVVVTESDTDRAFYQEINDRLLSLKRDWGIPNCLFINAQNKQTVKTIIKPLRSLGIPAAAVVDIDVLKEGGSVWTSLLESGFLPEISHQPLSSLRAGIKTKLEQTGRSMKRDGGLDLLQGEDKEAGNNLFDQLAEYGLFVVRRGELESWLQSLGVTGHGPTWLIGVFEAIGEDPDSADYLRPNEGDVWKFIFSIKKWFSSAPKKGIPS